MDSRPIKKYFLKRNAFSLIEVLVSIAVLSLLVYLFSSLTSQILQSWQAGLQKIDNFSRARAILQTIARDIHNIVIREDLGKFTDHKGENALAFYTRLEAIPDSVIDGDLRRLSLVYWSKEPKETTVYRHDLAIGWNDHDLISFSVNDRLPLIPKTTARKVGVGVLAFHWAFLSEAGIREKYAWNSKQSREVNRNNQAHRFSARAIRISLAVIDNATLQKLNETQLIDLMEKLGDVTTQNISSSNLDHLSLLADWKKKTDQPAFFEGYPREIKNGLKFFERFISLPLGNEASPH